MSASPAEFWRRQARRTARRHNFACALAEFLRWGVGLSAVFACALLIARQNGAAGPNAWLAYGAGLLCAAEIALRRARARFFSPVDALVRLESHLRLHNRLSAAAAGVGPFPPAQPVKDGYAFDRRKVGLPLAGAVVLVAAAAWIPTSQRVVAYRPPATPIAWTQTAQWIDALKKSEVLQEPPVEELRERLEQLRKQPAEDWYSQSSLEAGDHLHGQTEESIQALQRDLQSAAGSLDALERHTDGAAPAEAKAAQETLAAALKGLAMGNLPLNSDLLSKIKEADLANLKLLTPAQLAELKERLQRGDKVCQNCLHPGEIESQFKRQEVANASRPGGKGGGKSSPPLALNNKPAELDSTELAPVASNDLQHALPGDLMGVGKGEHPVDPAQYTGPASAGAIASIGGGGEAVSRNDLTPAEREALKNFFK